MNGATVCRAHGGAAPQTRAAASRRLAEDKATRSLARQGVRPLGDPLAAFSDIAAEAVAVKEWAAGHVAELQDQLTIRDAKGTEQLREVVALYERAMDRAGRLLAEYVRLGIAERQVALTEAQAAMLAAVLDRVLTGVGLDPADPAVRRVVHAELLAAGGDAGG